MYTIKDYAYNGLLYLNNIVRPRHKRLSQLMIYSTTACQSRCKHCHIWQKPVEHLSLDDIKRIMQSRCVTRRTTVGLEGGEFILHPQAAEIMAWFREHHPNYTLLSNCLAPRRVIDAVRRYQPRHLYVSLDGGRETYQRMRGRDGYDRVIQVVETLKDKVPLSLMFCLSPWNSLDDMAFVIDIAKHYHVDVRIGIYGTMAYMVASPPPPLQGERGVDTLFSKHNAQNYILPSPVGEGLGGRLLSLRSTSENFDFVALYDQWRKGNLRLRCQSIMSSLVVHSNGDVPLCQNLDVVLGNIHHQTLDDIFNGSQACQTQCRYSKDCNGCWINFHRKYDIILLRSMERLLPKRIIEKIYGPYQWTNNPRMTYRQYFRTKVSNLLYFNNCRDDITDPTPDPPFKGRVRGGVCNY
ncbi:MAG: radical SAM protein [Prevotella sp.]|nr:radical SAM protein [Prevotella sp.]